MENMFLTMSPVGVVENETARFVPGRVMIETSKGSRASTFSAIVPVGEVMTRRNDLGGSDTEWTRHINIERGLRLEMNVMVKESIGEGGD